MGPKHGGNMIRAIRRSVLWLAFLAGFAPAGAAAADDSPAYLGPCALVASPDAETLYVACADAGQVVWVSLSGETVTRRVSVPGKPTGVALAAGGTQLIVTCAAPQSTVAVLDTGSGRELAAIPAGHTAMSPTVSPDGTRLYVCNRFDNDISVIDLKAGRELSRVAAVREPIAAALAPDGGSLWVANHLPNMRANVSLVGRVAPMMTVLDTHTLKTATVALPSGSNSLRGVCVSPDGKYVFVTHLLSNFQEIPFRLETGWINTNVLSIIDAQRRQVIRTIGMDEFDLGSANPWDVALSPDGKTVCVSIAGTHDICTISRSDLLGDFARRTMQPMMSAWPIYTSLGVSLWRRNNLPGNGPRGLTFAGSRLFVAEYFSDSLAVLDLAAGPDESARTIALGPPPQLTRQRRGELLFHDATICYQQWQSCASCHPDGRVDGLNWDLMNDGGGNPKNTKSMLLAHETPPAMAVGVRATAEEAVRSGLIHILFTQRPEEEAVAIDDYLKSLQPVPSPRRVDGRLSAAAERGRELFHSERVGCDRCHPAPRYTDLKTHNVGTRNPNDLVSRFDTPTLVETWRTAPYLHDGRYLTLEQVFTEGRHGLPRGPGNELTEEEIRDLVEFVLSL
jgi:YVTN family beta-propeller protein